MQFKHPEILYFLALLIIPILVHLFQLQRFVKVPFTNVAFLKNLAIQTRKSSQIKKWLVLVTRLGILAAIVLAFAGPYFSNNAIDKKQNTFIYLDNSLSNSAKGKKGDLLKISAQEIIENAAQQDQYTLLTNTNFFKNISYEQLQDKLLNIQPTAQQITIDQIALKISNLRNELQENILISDFQNTSATAINAIKEKCTLIQLRNQQQQNISIDSVFVSKALNNNFNVRVFINNQGKAIENLPISINNNSKLLSKQTFSIDANKSATVNFTIQKQADFNGKLSLTIDDSFAFDNEFYFSLNTAQKIKVLAIGATNKYLSKIFTSDVFKFSSNTPKSINFNILNKSQLVILNELKEIPQSLQSQLTQFANKGGNILCIPNTDVNLNSYNKLFKSLNAGSATKIQKDSLKITKINFNHPILKQVFDKRTSNFQYPSTVSHIKTSFNNANDILYFENNQGFIKEVTLENARLFWVAASLQKKNSNFTNSPLIVPVFYNIGKASLQLSKLFYRVNTQNTIDIETQLAKDAVLTLHSPKESFIPLQQTQQNKVKLSTHKQPQYANFYHVIKQKDTLSSLAFNYPSSESNLAFLNPELITSKNIKVSKSIKNSLQKIKTKNTIHWYWKWFLALAIVFLLLEILILKFFKV